MPYYLRDGRGRRREMPFASIEEAFAYATAVEDYDGTSDPAMWSLVDDSHAVVLPRRQFWAAAERWRQSGTERRPRGASEPGWSPQG